MRKSTIFFFIFSNVVRVYILLCHKKIDMAVFTSVLQLPRAELLKAWLALTIGLAVSKPIRCQGIKRLLTLTMLRATGP